LSLFIVFEGLDGSGKSTQQQLLNAKLKSDKISTISFREPGSTMIGNQIVEILQSDQKLSPLSELLLFYVSRSAIIEEKIKPALDNHDVVICDRYFYSSIAYQGYGRGIDINFINQINDQVVKNIIPDLIFYMDINWEEKKNRKGINVKDRFEKEDRNFHNKVRSGYKSLAKKDLDKWKIIDAEEDVNKISSFIYETVKSKLNI
jgi:dTMP kinase|tara:strand:- start:2263 stop:2874 length:612 start_codon:yes stop_codon:yes gene_type:complete